MDSVCFTAKDKTYCIPNTWEGLSPDQFVHLAGLLLQYAAGQLSMSGVRLHYVCYVLGIKKLRLPRKHATDISRNLYVLLSHVSFIFDIRYPANVWQSLSADVRQQARKTEPEALPPSPEARILQRTPYSYTVSACFAAQLLPTIDTEEGECRGYTVRTDFGQLSSSLTAAQYADASDCLSAVATDAHNLPLLASILYFPGRYSADEAHARAHLFAGVPEATLQGVALNFQAFVLFLFTRTHFSILWKKGSSSPSSSSKISLSLRSGLHTLSEDGYGDINTVGNIPLIDYLDIMRNKKIMAVKTMRAAKVSDTDIASRLDMDLETVVNIN